MLKRHLCTVITGAVIVQCRLHVAEDVVVIDQLAVLFGPTVDFETRYAVRSRDRLHQRVILHWFVDVKRRNRWGVESRQPHHANEYQLQRMLGILEVVLVVMTMTMIVDLLHVVVMRFDR